MLYVGDRTSCFKTATEKERETSCLLSCFAFDCSALLFSWNLSFGGVI